MRFETKDAADLLLPGRSVGGALNLGFDTNSRAFKATGAGYGKAGGFDYLAMVTREAGDDYTDGNGLEQAGTEANLVAGLAKLGYLSPDGHRFEASAEATEAWTAHVAQLASMTLYPQAASWYMGANIPGKPRVFLAYIGGLHNYRDRCERIAADGYPGFAHDARTGIPTRSDAAVAGA